LIYRIENKQNDRAIEGLCEVYISMQQKHLLSKASNSLPSPYYKTVDNQYLQPTFRVHSVAL